MPDTVSWLLILNIKEGQLDTFEALGAEMVESTREEPGTAIYEWFVSDDGAAVHIYERYADSDAVLAHLGAFQERFAKRFMAAAEPAGWYVFGEPSDAARAALAGAGAQFFGPLGGFAR
jgi:quinol monooxygenase YgiN